MDYLLKYSCPHLPPPTPVLLVFFSSWLAEDCYEMFFHQTINIMMQAPSDLEFAITKCYEMLDIR